MPFEASRRLMEQNSNTMRSEWSSRFSVKALYYYDELMKHLRGKQTNIPDRFLFENPTNPLGMEEVARTLGILSRRLRSERNLHK